MVLEYLKFYLQRKMKLEILNKIKKVSKINTNL